MTPHHAAEDARLERERTALKNEIADLFVAWAAIENRMAVLLETIIGDPNVAFAIYFTPSNTETRFAIVDAAVDTAFDKSRLAQEIRAQWSACRLVMDRLKNTRNKVAHGSIGTISARKVHVRLIPPKFDIKRWSTNGQLDGLSSSDIRQSWEAMKAIESKLWRFDEIIRGIQGQHKAPLQDIIRELEDRSPQKAREGGPTRPKSSGQPQPSGPSPQSDDQA